MSNDAPDSAQRPRITAAHAEVVKDVAPTPIARRAGVFGNVIDALGLLVLGSEPRLRVRLKRILVAIAVYALSMLAQWHAVESGLADRVAAQWLAIFIGLGVCTFYVLIRSGFTLRFADPAWTLPQMVYAIVSIALAYQVNPHVRGVLPMLAGLVIIYGVFTLDPKSCRGLGWFAVAVLGISMAYGAWRNPQLFPLLIETHHFIFVAASLLAMSFLAGELSQMRVSWKQQKHQLQDAMERVHLDALTGLPNRLLLADRMAQALALAQRQRHLTAVCYIDLDGFKSVNDRYGHAAGDKLLEEIGRRLLEMVRSNDTAARLAGDEFVLLLTHVMNEDECKNALERVMAEISRPIVMDGGRSIQISASIGVAISPDHGLQPEDLLRHADAAMYQAKRLGRNQVCLHRAA